MYLCKRKANKFRNLATLIFLNIAILGCSFSPVNSDSEIIDNFNELEPLFESLNRLSEIISLLTDPLGSEG